MRTPLNQLLQATWGGIHSSVVAVPANESAVAQLVTLSTR